MENCRFARQEDAASRIWAWLASDSAVGINWRQSLGEKEVYVKAMEVNGLWIT